MEMNQRLRHPIHGCPYFSSLYLSIRIKSDGAVSLLLLANGILIIKCKGEKEK